MRAPSTSTIENLMRYDFVVKQGTRNKTKENDNMECWHERGGLAWVRRESEQKFWRHRSTSTQP